MSTTHNFVGTDVLNDLKARAEARAKADAAYVAWRDSERAAGKRWAESLGGLFRRAIRQDIKRGTFEWSKWTSNVSIFFAEAAMEILNPIK